MDDVAGGMERTCLVTRKAGNPDDMIRFVVSPEGEVVPDLKRILPGRGVWVEARKGRVREAVKRRLFARGFRADVEVAPDLPEKVADRLRERALGYLALSNKAGLVVTGFEKIHSALEREPIAVLVQASDGAPEGRKRLMKKAAHVSGGEVELVESFTNAELSLALGGTNVIHAAVKKEALGQIFLDVARRFERYIGNTPVSGVF